MTLQRLSDQFDHATHRELDALVNKSLEPSNNLASSSDYAGLLSAIVHYSNECMNMKYSLWFEAKKLFSAHPELLDTLASAWEHKSYRDIRNLAILRAPGQESKPDDTSQDLRKELSESFGAEYCGAAVHGFYEYLTLNEKLFKTMSKPPYYARFCSIVQSSGTGKTRLLTELSKKGVIVIYMNLRGEREKLAFPARDPVPSEILTKFPGSQAKYSRVCYAFFIALFDTVEEYLSRKSRATRNTKRAIMNWVLQMCDMSDPPRTTARADFFNRLAEKYYKAHAGLAHPSDQVPDITAEVSVSSTTGVDRVTDMFMRTDVEETADDLAKITVSGKNDSSSSRKRYRSSETTGSMVLLFAAYQRMANCLGRVFPDRTDQPKMVIAVDEAHPLTVVHQGRSEYRPADIFCRIVNEYSRNHNEHAVWVVFASTTSKVADFSPPNEMYNSDRVSIKGEKLFPPYTQLGWDQSAWELEDIDIENVSQIDRIVDYGRPLWHSLKTALKFPRLVLDTASSKLCGARHFDAQQTSQVLAVLGQRFALKITFGHPDSVEHLENGVASHLLICLSTTWDRSWRFTSYPSEPLLSCAAAMDLHGMPENLGVALTTLLMAVNSGMIDMGQRGELASRLLWLLAKDLFIRARENVATRTLSTWEDHLADCEMIPVVDWLEFIFGPQIWDQKDTQASRARNTFRNAYLNFSHWVCMEANIAGSTGENELSLNEFTLRHWCRTSAVQCCHQQPLIDKMIPIYFKGAAESAPRKPRVSHIFISDKTGKSTSSKDVLRSITRRHENLGGEGTLESVPYIAILADFGQLPSFSVTFPERDVEDRCLRIYAAGIEITTYAFLDNHPTLIKTLRNLVHIQQIPETERPYAQYLNAQVRFSSTANAEHMVWERGKEVPDVRQELARPS